MSTFATLAAPPRPRSPQELANDYARQQEQAAAEAAAAALVAQQPPPTPDPAREPPRAAEPSAPAPPETAPAKVRRTREASHPPAALWRDLVLPAVVAVLPVVAVAGVELTHLHHITFPGGDFAMMTRDVHRAFIGHLQLGPYSRFGWRHPGPLLAYWMVPFYALAGHTFGGLALGAASLNMASMTAMVLAAGRAGGRRTAWATAAVCLGYSFSMGLGRLAEPWSPATVVLPLAACAVLAAAVAAGRRWMLPVLVLFASLCVQTHLGSVPVLLAFTVPVLALGLWRHRRELRGSLAALLVTVALAGACWAIPIHEQFTYNPGNLTRINTFMTNAPDAAHGWAEMEPSLEQLYPLTVPHAAAYLGGPVLPPKGPRTIDLLVIGLLVGGLVAGLMTGKVRGDEYLVGLAIGGIAAIPAAIYALSEVSGLIYPYLAFFAVSAGLVAWFVAADTLAGIGAAIALVFRERQRKRFRHSRPPLRPFAARSIAVGLVAVALLLAGQGSAVRPQADVRTSPAVARFAQESRQIIRLMGNPHRILVDLGQEQWPLAAGVVLDLENHGYDVHVLPNWSYLFGPWSVSQNNEQLRLVIAPAGRNAYPARPSDQAISTHDGATLYLGSTAKPHATSH